jgi:hypothetical protein
LMQSKMRRACNGLPSQDGLKLRTRLQALHG